MKINFLLKVGYLKDNMSFETFMTKLFPDLPPANEKDDYLEKKYNLMQENFFYFFSSLDTHRQEIFISMV
jgi:hypothetical protein